MTLLHKDNCFTDEDGRKMVDRLSLYEDEPGVCFMCKGLTHRLDIVFAAFFCDSDECNRAIEWDLMEDAKKYPEGDLSDFG